MDLYFKSMQLNFVYIKVVISAPLHLLFGLQMLCLLQEVFMSFFTHSIVGGKLFGFVHIDIECKNISISGDIGGLILSTK